jgi:tetratricopeptide (TPR) repeat protein
MNNTNDLYEQLNRYRAFYDQDPDNQHILSQLVDIETQLGEFDEAKIHLAHGLKLWPDEPALRFRDATIKLATGDAIEASDILKGLLKEGVDNAAVRYNLGYACLSTGDIEYANAMFESIDAQEVELPELPLMQSRTLHHLGQLDDAIAKAEDYLSRHPDSGEALGILALLHLDNEEYASAKKLALNAYAVDSDNREALITLGSVALEELEPAEAQKFFSQTTKKYPTSGRAWAGTGMMHMMVHDLDKAQVALETSVKYMPNHIGTWHALAWCQIVQGDLEGAQDSFNQANSIDHNFGETHGGLAVIAALRGDWETADRGSKVALRLDPESFAGRFAQSLALERKDPQAAQALIEKMLTSSPTLSGQSLQAIVSTIFRKRGAQKTKSDKIK